MTTNMKSNESATQEGQEKRDYWAVCRLCGQEIKSQQSGTFVRVSDGTTCAVHRKCANEV